MCINIYRTQFWLLVALKTHFSDENGKVLPYIRDVYIDSQISVNH